MGNNSEKKVSSFTIHYSDGTVEDVESGLLARQDPAGSVMVYTGGLDTPDFLTLLMGLEMAAEQMLKE